MLPRNVSFVDACYSYRGRHTNETDTAYVLRLAQQLEAEFLRIGPEKVAAFIAETISGASLGCCPAVPGYFRAVREVCDKYGVLLILDEVMSGLGKDGNMHAWMAEEDFDGPDIQTVAKALGAGFAPIGGILLRQKIVDVLEKGSGVLQHGHTYQVSLAWSFVEGEKLINRRIRLRVPPPSRSRRSSSARSCWRMSRNKERCWSRC
jgi:adenosylmethionine-8-amino-7-oxononanoate aminotransferase